MRCNDIRHEMDSDEKEGQGMERECLGPSFRARCPSTARARWRKHICVFPAAIITVRPGAGGDDGGGENANVFAPTSGGPRARAKREPEALSIA